MPWFFSSQRWCELLGLHSVNVSHNLLAARREIERDSGGKFFQNIDSLLPNPEADENDYKLPAPSSVAFAQRIENRPPEDKVQQFWSLCKIDNLTVTFGAKDVLIQMPLLAYMKPGKLAAILFHEEAITNQIVTQTMRLSCWSNAL